MKTIVSAIMLLAVGVLAQIPGTIPLSGPIAPYSLTNTYPTHISKYGKGGFVTVANTAERDAFPAERREAGMMIAVAGGGTFQLSPDLTNWSETLTVDARNFGAVPNSPISRQDSSGSSSSAGIQAAIDYVFSRGGGVVKVPAGSWMISTPVNVKPRVRLVGEGTGYTQGYETNALYLSGATRFYPAPGSTQDMVIVKGSDSASLSAPVTVFTSGDLSLNTNYNHGGAIVGISFDSGYTGIRGRSIYLEGIMGFTIDDVAFAPYGSYYPISIWACNGVHIHAVKGLTQFPIMLAYSADCTVDDCFVGGNYGPTLWIKGAKSVVTGNKFFNSQAQPNSIRPTFTVNATTDTITVSDANAGKRWFDTFPLTVDLVSGVLPGNLATNIIYYAVRVSGSDTDFKIHTRRERNAGGTGGAAQGNFIDITDAGSGTFNIGPGPVFNLLVDQYDQGTFVGNQLDQSYGDGLGLWSAYNNSFIGNAITEHGWNAASSDYSAVRLMGQSLNNQFIGNIIGNRSSSSHGSYGLTADAGSTNNMWYGQLTGVTNIFGANPNVWFAQRWNYSTKRLEVYNSGWRTVATLDPGVDGVSYTSPGYMEMVAPTTAVPAARFTSIAGSETVNLLSYAVSAGQGAGLSSYAHRGTPGSPSQTLAGDELFEWIASAYGTNGYVFSIASLGAITAGPVLPGNSPTRLFGATTPTNSSTRSVRWITYENGATAFGNEGISFASAAPAGTALQVVSTTGLMVPPIMTTTQRDAIASPPTFGLLGNSTSGQLEWWTGTGYTNLGAGGGGGGGSGSVTSVGLTSPSWLTVGGSPVTTSGTLALTATAQTSNTFLAGPTSGAASASAFRALHANDLWAITNLTIDTITASNLTASTLVIQTNLANEAKFTNGLTVGSTRVTDLNALQPVDADLTADAALSTTGIKVRTGAGSAATRTITAGDGITLANGDGVSGNPTISTKLVAGANVTLTTNTGTITIAAAGGGGGTNASLVNVNSSAVSNPNFAGTVEITNTVSGTNISMALRDSGVSAGTYSNLTALVVDSKGRITSATSGSAFQGLITNLQVNGNQVIDPKFTNNTTFQWVVNGSEISGQITNLSIASASIGTITLTNGLGVASGGSGRATLTSEAFLVGQGTSAIKQMGPVAHGLAGFSNSIASVITAGTGITITNGVISSTGGGGSTNASILDTAYGSGWNGDTTNGPSRNALYDILHVGDTDDDGKADVVDLAAAGYVRTTSGGVISAGTTSANLASDITDETGTDKLVYNNAPTLTNAVLTGTTTLETLNVGTLNVSNTIANASLDSDLAAIGNNGTSGILVRTGSGTAAARTVVAGSALDFTITNGDGVSGNPSIAMTRTAGLGGNPALGGGEAVFGTAGVIYEGTSADNNEGLDQATTLTADRTWTKPDASGTYTLDDNTSTLSNKTLASPVFTGASTWPQNALAALGSVTNYAANLTTSDYQLITATNDVNFLHATNAAAGRSTTILVLASGANRTVTLPATLWMRNAASVIVTNDTIVPINIFSYGSNNTNIIATVGAYYSR